MNRLIRLALLASASLFTQVDWNWQITNTPVLTPEMYQFTRTNGKGASGNLSAAGAGKAITFTPCPLATFATDGTHYVRIAGGTGTAEAAFITGATCTSNAASGTITVTTAQTHTGAWAVTSAAGGLKEAINAATSGGTVLVNQSITAYSPTVVSNSLTLACAGGVTLTWGGAAGVDVITIAANNTTVRDCTIAAGTAGSAIKNSGTRTGLRVENNHITGGDFPVYFTAGSDITVTNNHVSGFTSGGIVLSTSVAISYVRIFGNYVDATGSTALNGVGIAAWGSHTAIFGNIVKVGGNADQGILFINNPGAGLTDGTITGNLVLATGGVLECIGVGSASNFTISANVCVVVGTLTGPSFYGYEINASNHGTVTGNGFRGNDPTTTQAAGIALLSSSFITCSGNQVSGWGSAAGSIGIALTNTSASLGMSYNQIVNNTIIATVAGTTPEIFLETLVAGTVSHNTISNNTISGVTTAGHVSIHVANSGGATSSYHRIQGNSIDSCDTGIKTATGLNMIVDGNQITNAATASYVDTATTTKIIDDNGAPFAFLGSQANGSRVSCTDCAVTSGSNNTCAGSGTGAFAVRINGVWRCFNAQN